MSAYVIAQLRIDDPETFETYLGGFDPIFERHGGELLAAPDDTEILEGEWAHPGTVIMKFPTVEHARRWYEDPDYQKLAQHRWRSAQTNLVLVADSV